LVTGSRVLHRNDLKIWFGVAAWKAVGKRTSNGKATLETRNEYEWSRPDQMVSSIKLEASGMKNSTGVLLVTVRQKQ
jgi:hypothetical protein